MRLELSEVVRRPPADAFRFLVTDHVQNHPRWDPSMSLTPVTPGPIGVGTVIRRSHTHGGSRVEGEMEVVELEPGRSATFVIRDGSVPLRSTLAVEPEDGGSSRLTVVLEADMPLEGLEEPVRGSLARMKELIEDEPGG